MAPIDVARGRERLTEWLDRSTNVDARWRRPGVRPMICRDFVQIQRALPLVANYRGSRHL